MCVWCSFYQCLYVIEYLVCICEEQLCFGLYDQYVWYWFCIGMVCDVDEIVVVVQLVEYVDVWFGQFVQCQQQVYVNGCEQFVQYVEYEYCEQCCDYDELVVMLGLVWLEYGWMQ